MYSSGAPRGMHEGDGTRGGRIIRRTPLCGSQRPFLYRARELHDPAGGAWPTMRLQPGVIRGTGFVHLPELSAGPDAVSRRPRDQTTDDNVEAPGEGGPEGMLKVCQVVLGIVGLWLLAFGIGETAIARNPENPQGWGVVRPGYGSLTPKTRKFWMGLSLSTLALLLNLF
jgi:hypothetical protein